jgi:tRNA-specific 2-thiouridylase
MPSQFNPDERLVVAMSGGVDSSVAAWMLAREGHDLVGLFMRNGVELTEEEAGKKSCCSSTDARDARMVADDLGISFQAVDLSTEFGSLINHFVAEYGRGRTPNPCALCNRDLKLGRLLALADDLGAVGVATGHYARLQVNEGRVEVRRGVDDTKDQSYQLFCVREEDLARTVLPLGDLTKPEVRRLAEEAGLRTHHKRDSQEICFVPSNDYRLLLEQRGTPLHPGELVDTADRILGYHKGTEHFTIGQRRGIGVGGGEPLYVVEVEPESGRVVVGTRGECGSESMVVESLNWIGFDPPASGFECLVQHRYHCTPAPCRVELDGDRAEVRFNEPEVSVSPGQGAAFYHADRLLGGGWIRSTVRSATTQDSPPDPSRARA